MWLLVLFKLLLALIVLFLCKEGEAICGYKSCPVTQKHLINVHLVPHSHDDVGWLKTVDQYYYGSRNNIQHAGVEYILDNVVQELLKDVNRRFIYVESALFFKWYNSQKPDMQKNVQKLVEDGRLEFVGGAWSMNDEATVHYQSVIDQFTLGLRSLNNAFGECGRPRVAWQIDPFGHSREMASLLAQMGYDGEFFARLDWVEKSVRVNNLTAEMIWQASENLGESSNIFTGILFNHYSAPPGFCFDALCSDAPIIDGESADNNVQQRVNDFLAYLNNMAKYYRANQLMIPMGDDFNYENAVMNFKNMDKLIKYVNQRQMQGSKFNVFYSTPSCYLNAVHNLIQTWPVKTQDFFPYSSDWHSYWTGYYTSRPTQKRFERDGNHFLQVVKQLTIFANLNTTEATMNLDRLRDAMGVMQHHDAITGTEKEHVAKDYSRMLTQAIQSAQENTKVALQKLTGMAQGEFVSCLLLNVSICDFTQNNAENLVVTLYNPLAHSSLQYVRVPVQKELYQVVDNAGVLIRSELVPVPIELSQLNISQYLSSQHELVFAAKVDKIGNYFIKVLPMSNEVPEQEVDGVGRTKRTFRALGDVVVQNSLIKLTFSNTGHLVGVEMNGVAEDIRQDFYYYKGAAGNNREFQNRSSGAYIFRPNGTEVLIGEKVNVTIVEGNLVKEVHQRFSNWVSQVIRLYEGINRVEFEWLIGPIPVEDNIGKEVITRFSSGLNNKDVFWTDSNGREMLRRVRNERELFTANLTEQISGNYYPVTTRIALQDEQKRIAILNDRAQGGTSTTNGSLELMLHRRLLNDDAFGVGEALNEEENGQGLVARGKYYLILSAVAKKPTIHERLMQHEIHLPFWKFFSTSDTLTTNQTKLPDFSFLPSNVGLLSLEPYSATESLLRLENFMDNNETSTASFNIRTIFDALRGQEIYETTLDGSKTLMGMERFKFQADGTMPSKVEYYTPTFTPLVAKKADLTPKFNVTLEPMQIRTFIIKWK